MAGIFHPAIFQNESGSVGQKLFQVTVVVATPTPTLSPGGAGRAAWRDHYAKPKHKKRRELLEQLDDAVIELQARVQEQSRPPDFQSDLAKFELAFREEATQDYIRRQISLVRMLIQEMDDEDTILLSLH